MSKLEEYILKNRKLFDDSEPSAGHFNRFEAKLNDLGSEKEKPRLIRFGFAWRAAAAVLLLIVASVLYRQIDDLNITKAGHSRELPAEFVEATTYYANLNREKINAIGELAEKDPEIKEIVTLAKQEAEAIESNAGELKDKYAATKDDRIIDAIITNYRVLSDLLDHIIQTLSETRQIQ